VSTADIRSLWLIFSSWMSVVWALPSVPACLRPDGPPIIRLLRPRSPWWRPTATFESNTSIDLYREGAVIQIKRWSIFGEARNSSFRRRPRAKRDASLGRTLSVQLAERTRPMHQIAVVGGTRQLRHKRTRSHLQVSKYRGRSISETSPGCYILRRADNVEIRLSSRLRRTRRR
jgi:hypothetical protein